MTAKVMIHNFSLMIYRLYKELEKVESTPKRLELIEQGKKLIADNSDPIDALRAVNQIHWVDVKDKKDIPVRDKVLYELKYWRGAILCLRCDEKHAKETLLPSGTLRYLCEWVDDTVVNNFKPHQP